eukprot:scaffold153220_cov68-Attheya_sp.AAC.1
MRLFFGTLWNRAINLLALLCIFSQTLAFSSVMSMSATSTKVAVIGSTGKLGRQAVLELSSRNIHVRCLLRKEIPVNTEPSIEKDASSSQVAAYLAELPGVEMIKADVSDVPSLETLVQDCTSCLSFQGARRMFRLSDLLPWNDPETDQAHARHVNYEAVRNLIKAAQSSSTCKRILRITGKGENPWSFFSILINGLGGMAKAWNYEGEELLRQCPDVDYTIVRPGVMGRPCPEGKVLALADDGGDLPVSAVTYEQIAKLCVDSLDYDNVRRSTLCAMNVPSGEGESSYAPLLASVKPDRREFPKSMLAKHRLAVRTCASLFVAVVAVAMGSILSAFSGLLQKS